MFENEIEKRIPSDVNIIYNILNNRKFDAYIVGGALRDIAINEIHGEDTEIKDWDLATKARQEDMESLFNKILRVRENGRTVSKQGKTIKLIKSIETTGISLGRKIYEVTPFNRTIGDKVEFLDDIIGDLADRDFSINAMAYNKETGLITKFVTDKGVEIDAIADIENKILRYIGNPISTLIANRSAMFRAILLANRLGFDIEEETLMVLKENMHELLLMNKGKTSVLFEKLVMMKELKKVEYLSYLQLFRVFSNGRLSDDEEYKIIRLLNDKDRLPEDYIDRLRFLYVNFENKEVIIDMLRNFGVNKDILVKIQL